MRAGGEERGPVPGVFYKRFRKWPICFGRSDYVGLSGPPTFPSLWLPAWISALLGLPSPARALIVQNSQYERNGIFHFFFKLHGNPHPHIVFSHFIFHPPEEGGVATTGSSLVHPKKCLPCVRGMSLFFLESFYLISWPLYLQLCVIALGENVKYSV